MRRSRLASLKKSKGWRLPPHHRRADLKVGTPNMEIRADVISKNKKN
jgi:hypothetical protein